MTTEQPPLAFAYVVISVADMDRALGLWVERFGMQVVTRRDGSDPGLARAWGLPADGIVEQVLLRTPGMTDGGVHLVRFRTPGPTVREGAAPTDRRPHLLDGVLVAGPFKPTGVSMTASRTLIFVCDPKKTGEPG